MQLPPSGRRWSRARQRTGSNCRATASDKGNRGFNGKRHLQASPSMSARISAWSPPPRAHVGYLGVQRPNCSSAETAAAERGQCRVAEDSAGEEAFVHGRSGAHARLRRNSLIQLRKRGRALAQLLLLTLRQAAGGRHQLHDPWTAPCRVRGLMLPSCSRGTESARGPVLASCPGSPGAAGTADAGVRFDALVAQDIARLVSEDRAILPPAIGGATGQGRWVRPVPVQSAVTTGRLLAAGVTERLIEAAASEEPGVTAGMMQTHGVVPEQLDRLAGGQDRITSPAAEREGLIGGRLDLGGWSIPDHRRGRVEVWQRSDDANQEQDGAAEAAGLLLYADILPATTLPATTGGISSLDDEADAAYDPAARTLSGGVGGCEADAMAPIQQPLAATSYPEPARIEDGPRLAADLVRAGDDAGSVGLDGARRTALPGEAAKQMGSGPGSDAVVLGATDAAGEAKEANGTTPGQSHGNPAPAPEPGGTPTAPGRRLVASTDVAELASSSTPAVVGAPSRRRLDDSTADRDVAVGAGKAEETDGPVPNDRERQPTRSLAGSTMAAPTSPEVPPDAHAVRPGSLVKSLAPGEIRHEQGPDVGDAPKDNAASTVASHEGGTLGPQDAGTGYRPATEAPRQVSPAVANQVPSVDLQQAPPFGALAASADSAQRAVTEHASALTAYTRTVPHLQTVAPAQALRALGVQLSGVGEGARLSVAIRPSTLGFLEISAERSENRVVQIAVLAERPETLRMLERDTAILQVALAQAGVSVDDGHQLILGLSEHGASNDRQHGKESRGEQREGRPSEGQSRSAVPLRTARTGLLDLSI